MQAFGGGGREGAGPARGEGKTARVLERRSTLGALLAFRPLSPLPAWCTPVTLQGFTSRCSTGSTGSAAFSRALDRHHRTRLCPLGPSKQPEILRFVTKNKLEPHAPPSPAHHTVTLREMYTTRYSTDQCTQLQARRCSSLAAQVVKAARNFPSFSAAPYDKRELLARGHHWLTELSRLRFRTTPNVSVSPCACRSCITRLQT